MSSMRRIAIVTGICVAHDAISDAVLHELAALRSLGHEVRVFTHHSTRLEPPDVVITEHPWALHQESFFRSADAVVYHFGTGYMLFNALRVPHASARNAVRFHNVTAPGLLSGAARERAYLGLDQASISSRAERVWCDSTFNLETVVGLGVDPERASVLELCVPAVGEPIRSRAAQARRVDGLVRCIAVGRFVISKGLTGLLDAWDSREEALERTGPVELVLAGNAEISDPAYLDELRRRVGTMRSVRLVETPADDALAELYRSSDILVVASQHEGFCVPVVEAIARGLSVVATDAGALPETVGEAGRIVPTGDFARLADALVDEVRAVRERRADGRAVEPPESLQRFSFESFTQRLSVGLDDLLGS